MNKKKMNKTNMLLIAVGIFCMVIGICGLVPILMDYYTAEKSYDKLAETFVRENDSESEGSAIAKVWYEMVEVDVAGLQASYSNVIGWLYFENEEISYPIMQTTDNDYYLNKTYSGTTSSSGSVFLDANSSSDFSDFHSIIYGHNMKNLSMFGRLKYYKTQEGYYDNHQYFQIFTEDEILRYQIFSYQECPTTSSLFQVATPASSTDIIKELTSNSMISPGITITKEDRVITLSTCTADDEHRFLVSAVLVDRHPLNEE